MKNKKQKVILIGWDAADWKVITPLMEQGKMPTLKKLVENGVMGNIATLDPPFSPMLWTSVSTGKKADKHGILGFIETDPVSKKTRPVSSVSRKVKAIWNILMQEGYKTSTVGWWPSHPAEPVNGVVVSNQFQKVNKNKEGIWKMQPGTVHPKEKEEIYKELRVHPTELSANHILPFVPNGQNIDQSKDKRLTGLAKIIAETASIQAAATEVLEQEDWDFMAVYFDGIDHFSHGFMDFHPPKQSQISQENFEMYNQVVSGAYIFHDMMLERQLELAGKDTVIILVSDHGFHSDHLRPKLVSEEPAGPAQQHSPYGIVCFYGPNIKKGEKIYGATLLDITPTILSALGLPLAEDMDGKPLLQIFENVPEIKMIDSWENIKGECGMFPPDMIQTPYEVQAEIEQLVELGYIEKPDDDIGKAQKIVQKETKYNLARVFMGSERFKSATTLLEDLVERFPSESRFALRLATCYDEINLLDESKELIEAHRKLKIEEMNDDSEFKELEENKDNKNEEEIKKAKYNLQKRKAHILIDMNTLDLIYANVIIKENNVEKGLDILQRMEKKGNISKNLFIKMGNAYSKIGKWKEAENSFSKALKLDSNFAIAHHGLGLSYLRQEKYEKAVEMLLNSIELLYHNPITHFHLGEALFYINYYEKSAEALEVCLKMNPNVGKARNMLIRIYSEFLDLPIKASIHKKIIEQIKKGEFSEFNEFEKQTDLSIALPFDVNFYKNLDLAEPIYIVSGLPRSGTSMMMQMLIEGGLKPYTDNKRAADENNPKGYFEHEAVKNLAGNKKWLKDLKNKLVKIISHQLFYLPSKYNYKIIFMHRDIKEIILSQTKMLKKSNKKASEAYPYSLEIQYKKNLSQVIEWANDNYNVSMIVIEYKDTIDSPEIVAGKINEFLDNKLDKNKMFKVVDINLYRSKI